MRAPMREIAKIINTSAKATRLAALLIILTSFGFLLASVSSRAPSAQAQSTTTTSEPADNAKCTKACHGPEVNSFPHEVHGKAFRSLNDSRKPTCMACHGEGTQHIAENEKQRLRGEAARFDIENPTELRTREERARANEKCMMCHARDQARFQWTGGEHDRNDMSCMSCHNVHHVKFPGGVLAGRGPSVIDGPPLDAQEISQPDHMLAAFTVEETCLRCHIDKRKALFQRSTHLFRTEVHNMKVGCTSCHNPHGGVGAKMLVESTVNNVCYTCHAEKRGPFLWDHPPVRENCLNCHSPHGSNNPKLLTARVHLLCQQCHIHMLPRHSTTAGQPLDIWSINRGCANCHGQVHGSNHPGGRTLTR